MEIKESLLKKYLVGFSIVYNKIKNIKVTINQRKPCWQSGGVPSKFCLRQKASMVSYFFLNSDYTYLCMLSIIKFLVETGFEVKLGNNARKLNNGH